MERIIWLACAVLLGITSAQAQLSNQYSNAQDRYINISNQTPYNITQIAFRFPNASVWHPNTDETVPPGNVAQVQFERAGGCVVEIQISLSNGDQPEWDSGYNICVIHHLTLAKNPTTGNWSLR